MKIDKLEELRWVLSQMQRCNGINTEPSGYEGRPAVVLPNVYLFEQVISQKPYGSRDVHEWGSEDEYSGVYQKIMDLQKVRILEAVKKGEIDKQLAGEILKTYYYKAYIEAESDGGVSGKREIVVRFV